MAKVQGKVGTFFLDRYEVTVADYRSCVDAKKCAPPTEEAACGGPLNNWLAKREQHPVNCIFLRDAVDYCEFRGKRLPSLAEFVAASPEKPQRPTCSEAVFSGCGEPATAPVGSKSAGRSLDGVDDLWGNVAELVGNSPGDGAIDLRKIDQKHRAIVHGGSYAMKAEDPDLRGENWSYRVLPHPEVGLRCASALPGKPQAADL